VGRVAIDFCAGQGANAGSISAAISTKRATLARTKIDATLQARGRRGAWPSRLCGIAAPGGDAPFSLLAIHPFCLYARPTPVFQQSLNHLAKLQDAPALALKMKNSVDVIMKHYRELVRPKDAVPSWHLKPSASAGAKIVSFATA